VLAETIRIVARSRLVVITKERRGRWRATTMQQLDGRCGCEKVSVVGRSARGAAMRLLAAVTEVLQ
jgi:hypothetical protein